MVDLARRQCSKEGCTEPVVGRTLCRKHYQAAWKAKDFANAPLEPRKRDRKVCPPDHKHAASTTCYIIHQCRCDPCMDHHAAVARSRVKLKAYGRFDTGLVDAEPIREHMMLLAEFGLGYKRIAELAGVGVTPVRNIIWGRQDSGPRYGELQKRIKRETAEAVLAVKPDFENLAGGARIPARGTHRRIQALVAIGWSQSKLSDRLRMERGNFGLMMQRDSVRVFTHLEVAKLFDELWNELPPREDHRDKIAFSRAKNFAAARRWLPPLAWDDIDNDVEPPLPDEDVVDIDEQAVVLAIQGERVRLNPLERREVVLRLVEVKLSDGEISERGHMAKETVQRIRKELGLAAPIGSDRQVVA